MKTKYTILIVLILSFMGKTLGFFRDIFITKYLGFNYKTDALLLSISIVTLLFSIFNTTIRTTFSPMFSSDYFKDKYNVVIKYNNIRNILLLISFIGFILIVIFSKQILFLFAPGLNKETLDIANSCLKILSVLLVLYNLYYLTTGFLQSIKIFTTVETANLFNNALIIISIIVLFDTLGIYSILIGYIVGALFQTTYSQMIFFKKVKVKLNFKFNLKDESWKEFIANSKFVLLGSLVAQVTVLLDKFVASFLSEGSISALHYANLIKNLPLTIIILAITNVLFTNLSIYYNKGTENFKSKVFTQIKYLLFIVTPFSIIIFVYSKEIVTVLFYRGEFSSEGVYMTSSALRAYSVGMYFWVIKEIYTKVSYAARDTKSPLNIAIISLTINFILNFILGFKYGHVGIALSTTIVTLINSIMIIYILHRKNIVYLNLKELRYFLKTILIFSGLLIISIMIKKYILNITSDLLTLIIGSLTVGILCIFTSRLMGVKISSFVKGEKI